MKVSRTSRLNGEYQKEISAIVSGKLKNRDPRLTGLISVTEADVAPDLKTANIYVSIFSPSEDRKKLDFQILKENAAFIRHELSQVMRMRTVPVLTFRLDESMEYGSKMDELFKKIHENESSSSSLHGAERVNNPKPRKRTEKKNKDRYDGYFTFFYE